MSVMRLLRTVSYLRPRQIAALVSHRVRQTFEDPAWILSRPIPSYPGTNPHWQPGQFLPPVQHNPAEALRSGKLTFLHQTHTVGWPPDWKAPSANRLWGYNLHYFDWLWSLDFPSGLSVASDWIDRHPPEAGNAGWEPYPTSLRLVNVCHFFFGVHQKSLEIEVAARDKVWASIFRQASWLNGHIESHLCGNHVLENAGALCVVGRCFAGNDAREWYLRGLELLRSEVSEQFLADGGHYERSPMYHSRAMWVLLMLRNLGDEAIGNVIGSTLERGMEALKHMSHPDGQIALLNDSACGVYNGPAELVEASGSSWPPMVGAFAIPETGYYGARTVDGSYIICDAGPIGPDHQPGHAHGDTLSFELSLRGHRVIVDSGVLDYEPGEMRTYCRSTRAHNTVEIDGRDQGEFWGTFRVGRRARVRNVRSTETRDGFELVAEHDGYGSSTIHQRTFRWWNEGRLGIEDLISGGLFVSRLHLAPECSVLKQDERTARVRFGGGVMKIGFTGDGRLGIEDSWYCPRFGQKLKNQSLAWSGQAKVSTKIECLIACE